MAKKAKVVLMACLSVVMCVAIIAVGTYAYFTDQVKVTNHLQAGTLDVTLSRIYLEYNALDDSGFLTAGTDDTKVDFTDATSKNVFGLEPNDLVVPGSSYTSTMEINNRGSVAASYWIEIKLADGIDEELASQLRVEVYIEGQSQPQGGAVGDVSIGSQSAPVGEVKAGKTQTFKVKVSFVDDDSINNLAEGKQVSFDLIVKAAQAV